MQVKFSALQLPLQEAKKQAPKFGRIATKDEFKEIVKQANKQGLNGSQLNPNFALIDDASWVPVFNYFKHIVPNGLAVKELSNDYLQWLGTVHLNLVKQPLAVGLTNYLTEKGADDFMKATAEEDLEAKIADSRRLDPNWAKNKTDTELGQLLLEQLPITTQYYKTGPKQVLRLFIPKELEERPPTNKALLIQA